MIIQDLLFVNIFISVFQHVSGPLNCEYLCNYERVEATPKLI
jgi:hypothetical protein